MKSHDKTILVVDDKASVRQMLEAFLGGNGFRVVTAINGFEALSTAFHEKPDLILLDVVMPEMDGYEFMRRYRKGSKTPVIMVTAKSDETDKVIGLELGADDYVTKPFGLPELLARIRALIRRVERHVTTADVLRVGDLVLDKKTHDVIAGGRKIQITPFEFDLLMLLMTNPGHAFSRTDLLERLRGNMLDNLERTIDTHVRNLRSKVEVDATRPHYIETVFGVGYRFNAGEESAI